MGKLLMTKSQKRQKPTAIEIERARAKEVYRVLLNDGHKSAFQLREALGGISESSFYKMTRSVFREKPYVGLVRWEPIIKHWYSPQREHYDAEKGSWKLTKRFREPENEKST